MSKVAQMNQTLEVLILSANRNGTSTRSDVVTWMQYYHQSETWQILVTWVQRNNQKNLLTLLSTIKVVITSVLYSKAL